MRILAIILTYLICSISSIAQINSGSPAIPFGSKIATVANPYGNGILPTNLPTGAYNPGANQFGKSQDAADAYNTWKTNYVSACGANFRVKFDNAAQTVSEGIAYGMLIAAYAGDKTLFDGLWGYYKANSNTRGVMNWRTGTCTADQSGGATDAELDAAMALLVAKCQWPSATSPYNYGNEATTLITAIKDWEIHPTSYQAINGDGWGFGSNCRNPSYQSPSYYRQYADHIPSQATFWNNNVLPAAYNLLNANRNTTTGLISNWSDQNGTANTCNGPNEYGYDACRNPWRMATEVLWYNNSTAQTNYCIPIAAYVTSRGVNASGPVPQAGGTATGNEATFSSMFAAGICGSNATYQTLMNNMYTKTVGTVDVLPRYFGNTLRVISLFMQTGNFWKPCVTAPVTISVALTAPTAGQTVQEGDIVTLTATASTTNGTITSVEFYNGTTLIGTDNAAPYTVSWTATPAGSAQIIAKAYNSAAESVLSSAASITIIKAVNQTATAPTIDGTIDAVWGGTNTSASLDNIIGGTVTNTADLSATYKAMWDATYFYALVNVTDNTKTNNAGTDYYNDDAVEVFFDIGNNKAATYGANDFQYTFRWNDNTVYEKNNKITGVTFARVDNATGYVMEMRFPWSTLTGTPAVNQLVGFDVEVNDDDDGGARDAKIAWAATADQAWTNPSYFGTVVLKGTSCSLPAAAGAIAGVATTCAAATGITYSIATVSGATGYTWTVPAGATITSGANTNSIIVSFGTASGSVSVTPTNTCGNGASSTSTITVNPSVTPSVVSSASATTICAGTSVTFTATPTNGGTPTYQWQLNNANISGATNATYSSTTLVNGDAIRVIMTSTANCRTANTATSSATTMVVNPSVTPSVVSSASATTICAGTNVTFTATPTNGGTPTYQWQLNNANISGATNATYSSTTLVNGDAIRVIMTSTANCRTANTATSSATTMVVNTSVTPSVVSSASATTICAGASVTFTATPTNGGTPTYQWQLNNANISGATNATYSSTTLVNGDAIRVIMTSTVNCRTANTATSSATTMVVNTSVTPSVVSSASATTICAGTNVTFTATPTNGGTPTYQWRKNSTNISGATNTTYATTVISNGDQFDVVMTSTANCRTANTATSSATTMVVNTSVTPSVTVSASATTICAGTSVTFTSTPTNGGTPTYQWQLNNANISGATNATYSSTTLVNGDAIRVIMTSTATCRTANSATSASISMTVSTAATTSVSIAVVPGNTIYDGQSVTFTATPVNGGTPIYQWRKNNIVISGETNSTYTTNTLINGDIIRVRMTSSLTCVTTATVNSNNITMTVNANPPFATNITGPANVVPNQTSVSYSVTSQPGMSYVWTVPAGATIVSGQNTNSVVINFGSSSGNVSVQQTNPAGQSSTISIPVTVGTTTAVSTAALVNISTFPIPCKEVLNIDLNDGSSAVVSYMFIDATGNVVKRGTFTNTGSTAQLDIDIPAGVYQLMLQWDGKTAMSKIVTF